MTPADLLQQAKELLIQQGWAQQAFENEKGQVCALGALNRAAQQVPLAELWDTDHPGVATVNSYAKHFLQLAVERRVPEGIGVMMYNDANDRKESEIHSLFDEAIILAKEAEAH